VQGLSTYQRLASDVLSPPFAEAVCADLVDVERAQRALDATADARAADIQRAGAIG
jgi:hypothetical protein